MVAEKLRVIQTIYNILLLQDLLLLFKKIDLDDDGVLTLEEIVIFFKAITDDLSMDNIADIFQRLDGNGDEELDFQEFKVITDYFNF